MHAHTYLLLTPSLEQQIKTNETLLTHKNTSVRIYCTRLLTFVTCYFILGFKPTTLCCEAQPLKYHPTNYPLEISTIQSQDLHSNSSSSSHDSKLRIIHVKQVSVYDEKEDVTSRINKVESANMYIWSIWDIKLNCTLLAALKRKLHQLATPSAQVLLKSTTSV